MSMDLFFYGTLRAPEVRLAVMGFDLPRERLLPGWLRGFDVQRVAGASYPMLVRAKDEQTKVAGVIATGLDSRTVSRLDRFEGSDYQRVSLNASVQGHDHNVQVYLASSSLVPAGPWDFESWYQHDRSRFMQEDFNTGGVRRPD